MNKERGMGKRQAVGFKTERKYTPLLKERGRVQHMNRKQENVRRNKKGAWEKKEGIRETSRVCTVHEQKKGAGEGTNAWHTHFQT